MAAPTFRAGWSNSTPASPQNWTIAAAIHDLLLLYVVNDNVNATFTGAAGFTAVTGTPTHSSFDGQDFYAAYKKDALGTETSVTLDTNSGVIGGILAFAGVDNTTPFDVTPVIPAVTSSGASPYSVTASITTVTDNCTLVALVGFDTSSGVDVVATESTSTWTKPQDLNSGFYNAAAFYKAAGAAGTYSVTITGTAAGSSAVRSIQLYALRPAVTGGTGAAVLASTLSASATVTPALTTAIRLAASVAGAAVITAALSTGIPLASTLNASATVTPALTTAIPLASSMASTASVSAILSGNLPLVPNVEQMYVGLPRSRIYRGERRTRLYTGLSKKRVYP